MLLRYGPAMRTAALVSTLPLILAAACGGQPTDGDDEVGSTAAAGSESAEAESVDSGSAESESADSGSESSSGSESDTGSGSESESSSGSESDTESGSESDSGSDSDSDTESDTGSDTGDNPLWTTPSLWYSVEDRLIYIDIDEQDGTVVDLVVSTISTELIDGQNGLTMLEDGSLIGSRESPEQTQIFWIAEPPTEASVIEAQILGVVPDGLRVEGLYTDCEGLVYLMDTGVDVGSAEGNRLLRFTGDYLAGDLSYEVITDLGEADIADIDDMGPGIDAMGAVTDGTGFAIDSGQVYDFNYNLGTGELRGQGGTWGVHVLGGPLFDDDVARLYLMNADAEIFEADPVTLDLSPVLATGPEPDGDAAPGWSGLAGPLTECETSIDPQ